MTTDETKQQRLAWMALHDELDAAHKMQERLERDIVYAIQQHVAEGAFTPAMYGTPSKDALWHYQRACATVDEVAQVQAEIARIRGRLEQHPYTAVVEQVRAEREAQMEVSR